MSFKSSICFGQHGSRTSYCSEGEAQNGARYVERKYQRSMVPYRCEHCGYWHLSPQSHHTPSELCVYCTDHCGKPKQTYRSENEALCRADIRMRRASCRLTVYQCPYGCGWHLTSR